jgi:hypothetical protein
VRPPGPLPLGVISHAALGILAAEPRTLGSLSSLATGPAGAPSASHPLGPLPVGPVTGKSLVGPPGARAHQGDTMASHRRQADAVPPGPAGQLDGQPAPGGPEGSRARRRGLLRPGWLAAAALILIAAGVGIGVLVRGGSGSPAHGTATPSQSAKPKAPASALMNALMLANNSADAKGDLPPSTCRQQGTTKVTCTAPAAGINGVVFQTYPSLAALHAAYTAHVEMLNNGQFQANFKDCGLQQTFGEVSWNHQFQHPRKYSLAQSSSGKLADEQAEGRVYCNFVNGQENMVWTQNDGHLLAYVSGPVHQDVWAWWVAVHHNIGFGSSMQM